MADQQKFGIGQISNPTPSWVNISLKVFSIVTGAIGGWLLGTTVITPTAKAELLGILTTVNGLLHGIAPLFGVDIDAKTVNIDKVTAVDTTSSKP